MAEKKNTDGDGVIRFDHKFFTSLEGMYFRLSEQMNDPVIVCKLSEDEAVLPFEGIKKEFNLKEKSHDAKMLDMIAEGLGYIKVFKLGDTLPAEVLTGEASWEVDERHKEIAHQRVTLQLVSWLTGDESDISNVENLAQMASDPAVKAKVNDAIGEAAEKLGFGEDKEKVLSLIATLASELSHIEALREKFQSVLMIEERVHQLGNLYSSEISILEIINPIKRLMTIAREQYQGQFDQCDAQTGEILSVLRNIGSQIKFIHKIRDDLYKRLIAWNEMFEEWGNAFIKRSANNEELLRKTYQFLAPRFMQVDEWVLFTQLQDGDKEMKSAMRW